MAQYKEVTQENWMTWKLPLRLSITWFHRPEVKTIYSIPCECPRDEHEEVQTWLISFWRPLFEYSKRDTVSRWEQSLSVGWTRTRIQNSVYCCCVCMPSLFVCLVEESQDLATGRLPTSLSRKQPMSVLCCSIFYKYVALSFTVMCHRIHPPLKYDLRA